MADDGRRTGGSLLGRTHAVTGVAATLGINALTGTLDQAPLVGYAVAAGSALLPDLDQHAALALRIPGTRLVHPFLRRLRHRGPTHSLIGVALFGLVAAALLGGVSRLVGPISPHLWSAAMIGYASHLFADMWNKRGIALFWGLTRADSPLAWVSVPLPRALRISTVHDRESIPFTPGRLQARIPTERVFFRWPAYLLIGYVFWHNGLAIAEAVQRDVWGAVGGAPSPLRELLADLLR